eukprot:CAMPEP_0194069986 /NCGR_PEP_ID=MMETSP0009_2-20130614/87937_1 /TAXON_ID=210454 /ORGANISM="Grammatophora oceanica, Strain CCMP 410" /LENGTH=579 /DNA_ID=CAMNT_0038723219 /DNA_START=56 /DNA_END=1798 /DNA_ORIENTATION=-
MTLSWKRSIYEELRDQSTIAFPTLAGMVISKIPWFVTLRFVGLLGNTQQLAAAALALTLRNLTGLSLSVGLSSALATLTAQSRGDLQMKLSTQKTVMKGGGGAMNGAEYDATENTSLLQSGSKTTPTDNSHKNDLSLEPLPPLVYLYRGMFIQLLFVLPMILWWLHGVSDFLISLGQGPQLSQMTEAYLQLLAPGLICYSINWTFQVWLQNLDMAFLPAYATTFATVCHLPLNMFWIHYMGWGYLGAAMATTTYELIQPTIFLIYIFGTRRGTQRTLDAMAATAVRQSGKLSFWPEFKVAVSSLTGALQYLGLALPGLVGISEWWASEITIFLAGRLQPSPDLTLGAMTIFQCINTFCFMVPMSGSIAGSARVGSLLGAKDADGAKWASRVNVSACAFVSAFIGISLYLLPHGIIPSLFAPDQDELIDETSKLIPLLAWYVFGDGVQQAFNGTIKGCGRQAVAIPVVLIAYWGVAVPLAYYLAFIKHPGTSDCDGEDGGFFCGVVGLVTGTTTGTFLHMILYAVLVLCFTNWNKEAQNAQERLERDRSKGVSSQQNRRSNFAEACATTSSIAEDEADML